MWDYSSQHCYVKDASSMFYFEIESSLALVKSRVIENSHTQ